MDPNAALENILRGYMIAEHAEALEDWFTRDGFAPTIRVLPELNTCAHFVRAHVWRHYNGLDAYQIRVRADSHGLWSAPIDGQWISLGIWPELARMVDQ